MGAVNQLLASTGLQVSASNPNNNINNNNLPGSKLMSRRKREEYEDDEQYAGDKYIETDDMDDLEDDDYSMSESEYPSDDNDDVSSYDETPSDDYSEDYSDDYREEYASADGELGLRSNEDTTTYQINTDSQYNQLNPVGNNNMDMYIGTSNLYSDLVGLKPETFRSESMDNEFNANDYIGFNPENNVLPSVSTDSIVGSFTGDDGIFSSFSPNNENAFVPTLDGTFGLFGGEPSEESSPFIPSIEGAIGLGLGIGLGSALTVPTTMFDNTMGSRNQIEQPSDNEFVRVSTDFNKSRSGTVGILQPKPYNVKSSTTTNTPNESVVSQPVPSEPEAVVSQSVTSEPESVVYKQHTQSESSNSDEKDKESVFEKADKKAKKMAKRMEEHRNASSEKKINQYERSARELMNKNELSTNQYEAVRAAKEHSNEMADLRRRNQLAELQHTVAMRAKDKEMLDMMRGENIDSVKYNTEMQNRTNMSAYVPQQTYASEMSSMGSGLDDILGVGGGNMVNSGFTNGFGGMSLDESLGIGGGFGGGMSLDESLGIGSGFDGFGGMGVSLDGALGFGVDHDYPDTMNGGFMEKAKSVFGKVKKGTETAGGVVSDIGNTLYKTRTNILNKTNPYREAYSKALEQKNAIKERELSAKQKLTDKQQEIRNANAMRAQEAREIRQARQLADMQHRIAMETQRQELAQMRQDAYDAQNMRNMMSDVGQALPNQGLSLGANASPMELGLGGFGGMSLGVGNSVGGFSGMGLGDTLGLPTASVQQPVQPQMTTVQPNLSAQYKSEAEKYPYSNSARMTPSMDDDYGMGGSYHRFLHSEAMGEMKAMKKTRKSTGKRTKKTNKKQVKRVKKVAKAKTR